MALALGDSTLALHGGRGERWVADRAAGTAQRANSLHAVARPAQRAPASPGCAQADVAGCVSCHTEWPRWVAGGSALADSSNCLPSVPIVFEHGGGKDMRTRGDLRGRRSTGGGPRKCGAGKRTTAGKVACRRSASGERRGWQRRLGAGTTRRGDGLPLCEVAGDTELCELLRGVAGNVCQLNARAPAAGLRRYAGSERPVRSVLRPSRVRREYAERSGGGPASTRSALVLRWRNRSWLLYKRSWRSTRGSCSPAATDVRQ